MKNKEEKASLIKKVTSKNTTKRRGLKSTPMTKSPSRLSGLGLVVLVGLINFISFVAILVFISKLPAKAEEFNKAKAQSEQVATKNTVEIARAELDSFKSDIEEVASYFPEESGLVDFVNQMEKLKEGSVVDFSFANKEPVVDVTGTLAVPVVIEFEGTWQEIDIDLVKIQEMPYLIRFVEVQSKREEGGDVVALKYGGFIYVDESFSKN